MMRSQMLRPLGRSARQLRLNGRTFATSGRRQAEVELTVDVRISETPVSTLAVGYMLIQ